MVCKKIKELNKSGEYRRALSALSADQVEKYQNCQNFPDLFILILQGYVKSKITENEVFKALDSLKKNKILDKDLRERIKILEAYSNLKDSLSSKIRCMIDYRF